ncbi:hypothetical protein SAMN05444320_102256 [Streptoalloteichus hindustanus]|uniref:Zinc-finger n=1 Tax=Streptoalloteichus hindustanus TaxID=2017 RepID=A0A1M4Y6T3_STRHI|nr:hypothetical protein SAMN05444320_102256 [Streptoalloteichus hindustanus]
MFSVTWQPHSGERHAYLGPQVPDGHMVKLLCGPEIEARGGLPKYPYWLWPECDACRDGAGGASAGTEPPPGPPSGPLTWLDIDLPAFGR